MSDTRILLENLRSQMGYYFAFSIPFLGIFLNCLSLYIFTRPSLNKTNMGFLYLWQTIIDILVLLFYIFISRSMQLFGYSLLIHYDIVCKILTLYRRFILHASSWLCVLTTFDRFLYVCYPNSLKSLHNKFKFTAIILCVFLVIAIINTPNLFFYLEATHSTNISTNVTSSQRRRCTSSPFINHLTDMVSSIIRTWLPITLMVTFDLFIIKKLNVNKMKLTRRQSTIHRKENDYTRNVIILNILFFLFNSPLAIAYFIEAVQTNANFQLSPLYMAIFNFYFGTAVDFSFAYQSLSFFINIISNKLYKNELLILFKLRSLRVDNDATRNNSISLNNTNAINILRKSQCVTYH
jgi:hypothetical protein